MTQQDRIEMMAWIDKLKTLEGRENYKEKMKCDDEQVNREITLAQNILKEEYEYDDLVRQISEKIGLR